MGATTIRACAQVPPVLRVRFVSSGSMTLNARRYAIADEQRIAVMVDA